MPGVAGPIKEPNFFPAPHLRRSFSITGAVQSAFLYACAPGYGEIYLNGKKLGNSERDPGFTNFDRRLLYVTHDVSKQIRLGENVVGAILGTGWYDVHDVATWHMNTAPWRQRPKLRLTLAIRYTDGQLAFVTSGDGWNTASGPILRDGVYTGEVYDARKEMPGWNAPSFDDSLWKPALKVEAPRGKLTPLLCPPIRIGRTITPKNITQPASGVYIVDMGENFAGHTQLIVKGPAGTKITMRYAELLSSDGNLNSAPIDHFMEQTDPRQPFQQDTYICKGSSEAEIWEQRFSWSGFRYVEVTGFPGTPTTDNFRGRFACTDLAENGTFRSSDETADLVQAATLQSFRSNAQGYPTDCPQREKNGWTGDAGLAVEAGLVNFDAVSFYLKWLDDFVDAQRPDGGLPILVPNGGWGNGERWPGDVCPPWDAAYILITWEIYRWTGDLRVLQRHIRPLQRYVDFFLSHRKADGLAPALGIGDWSTFHAATSQDFITNAYLAMDLALLSRMFSALKMPEEGRHYREMAKSTAQKTHETFYHADTHRYANGTQCAQGMALQFGIVPPSDRKAVVSDLAAQVKSLGHFDVGFLGAKFVTRALAEAGHADLAFRTCMQPTMPSYGYWVKTMGSTTLWEGWKAGPSYNHIMFGDISAWMYQWVSGVQQDEGSVGWRKLVFRPNPVGDLSDAMARCTTPQGIASCAWKRAADSLVVDFRIPPGSLGRLEAPAGMTTEGGFQASYSGGAHQVILRFA